MLQAPFVLLLALENRELVHYQVDDGLQVESSMGLRALGVCGAARSGDCIAGGISRGMRWAGDESVGFRCRRAKKRGHRATT